MVNGVESARRSPNLSTLKCSQKSVECALSKPFEIANAHTDPRRPITNKQTNSMLSINNVINNTCDEVGVFLH